jgi:NADPH:quinone reductase-like Zn-dependent oxidoreductase
MIRTEAWVLEGAGSHGSRHTTPVGLHRELYAFADLNAHEVLAEPIYGCWEGNMNHAFNRTPVDICRQRQEDRVVLGNAGVVRVLRTGQSVTTVKEDDLCLVFCNGVWDALGFAKKIYAYDAPGTVGLLAKQTKLHERQLIRLPSETRHTLKQWAAFSLRYITAWANWKAAYGCWRLQLDDEDRPTPFVWGWGGGATLAELMLAQLSGCQVAMISSQDERLTLIKALGIAPIDRRLFGKLNFDEERYESDPAFREVYRASEKAFLDVVAEQTRGQGVSIFIDFIGLPVFRGTLKALARPGVITTAGWRGGMNLSTVRAIECMNWHIHVHTHYARYVEGQEAVSFAEEKCWMPPNNGTVYDWENIPQLAEAYSRGEVTDYFPIFQVNTL